MVSINQINKEDRPYEKCLHFGPTYLTDAELLAVVIKCGSKDMSSVELAQYVLDYADKLSGNTKGILSINHITIDDLIKINGIGKVKAIQIKCIAELSRRIHKSTFKDMPKFNSPDIIADYYMEDLRHFETEHLFVAMLNTKHKLLGDFELSKGTVNASVFSPREVFIEALRKSAVYLVLIHNHPSGDPCPSREDILTTKRMKEAGNIIGISLIDHIIIGDNKFISLKQQGLF